MAGPLPISVFVITRDEGDRIGRTLTAVRDFADEIVVVDSGSQDDTREIARDLGAWVIQNPWPGYGPQKRFAEEQCRNTWLLNIDADEVVPPALATELRALFASGEPVCDAYKIPIAETFPGETAPHRFAHALAPVRLYHKDRGRYSPSPVFDRVELEPGATIGQLKTRIHHFSVRSLGEQVAKISNYTDQQADLFEAKGRKVSRARLLFEFPVSFFKAYVLRRHFLRGFYGYLTAMNFAFSRHLRLAKLHERDIVQRKTSK